jgi:hypothetical protein
MKLSVMVKLVCCLLVAIILHLQSIAQNARSLSKDNSISTEGGTQISNYDSQGRPIGNRGNTGKDSLQKRDQFADSITIYFRYFDSSRIRFLDSSVNDFAKRFTQPYWYINLGNYGTAAKSLLFRPSLKAGWDAGFHQFDVYNLQYYYPVFYYYFLMNQYYYLMNLFFHMFLLQDLYLVLLQIISNTS